MAGSFIADGNGNITSGVLDSNSATSGPQPDVPLTGHVFHSRERAGHDDIDHHPREALVFSVAISNKGISGTSRNGYSDSERSGQSDVVWLRRHLGAELTATSIWVHLAGNYAFGYSGIDPSLKRVAGAGAYQMDTKGGLTNGEEDVNDNGVPTSATFTRHIWRVTPSQAAGRQRSPSGRICHSLRFLRCFFGADNHAFNRSDASTNLTLWSIAQQHASSRWIYQLSP